MLRKAGYDAYGVDIRWPGADFYGDIESSHLGPGVLRYYEEGGRIPFDDETFDVIISDQVFEHVVPMAETVVEIERIGKPDGVMYHHFPSRTVLREGHIGIPLGLRRVGDCVLSHRSSQALRGRRQQGRPRLA